jgi:hypothetical protein
MFSTPNTLLRRTGKFDANRPSYLKQLFEEYESESTSEEKKLQVLANLGNFAYDPINYEYFRRFNILQIFLNNLKQSDSNILAYQQCKQSISETSTKRVSFSLAAICNSCLDMKNKDFYLKNNIISLVIACLINYRENDEIALNSITILMFLYDENSKNEISSSKTLIETLKYLSFSSDKRISNIAKLFLQDYC